jgi:hypothetical protein
MEGKNNPEGEIEQPPFCKQVKPFEITYRDKNDDPDRDPKRNGFIVRIIPV